MQGTYPKKLMDMNTNTLIPELSITKLEKNLDYDLLRILGRNRQGNDIYWNIAIKI